GRIEALWALSGAVGGAPPAQLLSRLYFDTLTHDDHALALLAEVVGPDRLLLGTDYPFATGDPSAAARVVRWAGADLVTRDAVLGGTLSNLLGEVRRRA
uniref:amidohydrolase family protein n=1 Tax=Pseudactinotalea sp. TaxID=1926260 RepID=UPI003B3A8A52